MPASIPSKNKITYIHIFETLRFCFCHCKLQFMSLLTYDSLPFWKSKQTEKEIVKSHDTQKYCITLFPLSVSKDFLTSESIISVSKLTFKKMKRWFLKPPKRLLLKNIYRMNLPLKVNVRCACVLFHLKHSWKNAVVLCVNIIKVALLLFYTSLSVFE